MAIVIRKIAFTGRDVVSELDFVDGLNLVYGASNTGKSFATKAIDYMLGGSRMLPDISERRPYERAWLGLSLPDGDEMLSRALVGGNFAVRSGLAIAQDGGADVRVLGAKHDHTDDANLSQFLLGQVGLRGKRIAVDTNGKKRSLSFRDISRFCIVDETTIQSEGSPIQTGSPVTQTAERSAFKLLLTGIDDSAIVEVVDSRTFKSSTSAQIEMLDDMLAAVDAEIENGFADAEGLKDQNDRLEATFAAAQADLDAAQGSIRDLLERKRRLGLEVSMATARLDDIDLSMERFAQLDSVYVSDIQRLEALDEAGFLLTLGGGRDCPLCGASPDSQRHHEEVGDVERVRAAAAAEAAKIVRQRADLGSTVAQLASDRQRLVDHLPAIRDSLGDTEAELERLTPTASEARRAMSDIMEVRDRVRRGLALLDQRRSLLERRAEVAARKPAGKAERPRIGVDGPTVHEFAQVVSQVLTAWNFPGERHVSFDEASYDLRIDGKLRGHNGKGVRAITHAAFKVALLIFCKERGLPHPGFLVLDTPLLTYRDPIGDDTLTDEDRLLASSSLKQHFFAHLSSLSGVGQFIVVENVDPPAGLASSANVVVFHGGSGGRSGLL
jgi:predicted nuclease with TOPRIM domain